MFLYSTVVLYLLSIEIKGIRFHTVREFVERFIRLVNNPFRGKGVGVGASFVFYHFVPRGTKQ